jgi:hypothetical protein
MNLWKVSSWKPVLAVSALVCLREVPKCPNFVAISTGHLLPYLPDPADRSWFSLVGSAYCFFLFRIVSNVELLGFKVISLKYVEQKCCEIRLTAYHCTSGQVNLDFLMLLKTQLGYISHFRNEYMPRFTNGQVSGFKLPSSSFKLTCSG